MEPRGGEDGAEGRGRSAVIEGRTVGWGAWMDEGWGPWWMF